jgi:acyl-CoA thioesterase-1
MAATCAALRQERVMQRRRFLTSTCRHGALAAAALAGPAVFLAACSRSRPVRGSAGPAGATVLALGDSLTYGTGAPPGQGYPEALAALTGWQVVNAGVPGDTSAQALARLPGLLAQHTPALVLLGIGGNDFLRRVPEAATARQLRALCEQVLAAGPQLLLVAVPRPTLAAAVTRTLADHPIYAELAAELKLPLHAGGWSAVLSDPALRSDEIHANAEGYRRFAEGLRDTARATGLLA